MNEENNKTTCNKNLDNISIKAIKKFVGGGGGDVFYFKVYAYITQSK